MNKSKFISLFAFILFWSLAGIAAEKPNIVFMLADDMGSYDVSWRGSEIKTPNLDKLALAGARLENFYVQPVCSPTRSAFLTGRYPMRYGMQVAVIRPWANYGLPLEERLLPEALREVGYTTAIFGKWHLGSVDKKYWPNQRGFDEWYGHLQGAIDYFSHLRDDKLDWFRNGELNHDEGYSTHLIGRETAKFIHEQPTNKPLFIYVPFNAAHSPWQVPESYKKPYAQFKEPRRTYVGMVAAMDEAIGQITEAIEKTGRRENTLFIFSSDNGGVEPDRIASNGPLRAGKFTLYEGGTRTCAFATWDKKIKPAEITAPMHIVDWYPTLLKLTGASLKQKLPLDGRDIWPCLTEGKPSPHEFILLNAAPTSGALRMGDWKLAINADRTDKPDDDNGPIDRKGKKNTNRAEKPPMKIELFNLAEDMGEKKNLADENPKKLKELRERYDALAKQAAQPKNMRK